MHGTRHTLTRRTRAAEPSQEHGLALSQYHRRLDALLHGTGSIFDLAPELQSMLIIRRSPDDIVASAWQTVGDKFHEASLLAFTQFVPSDDDA